jgi:hypothetical protein
MKTLRKRICLGGLTVLLALLGAGIGYGQEAAESPAAPPLWQTDPLGQGETFDLPCAPFQDRNGPTLIGDPELDSRVRPGWVAAVEVGVVVPHITNHLFGDVALPSGATDRVQLPSAEVGVNAMPKIELGYSWGQAAGELLLSYRFLVAEGSQFFSDLTAFAPTGTDVRSRLDLQSFALDYANYAPQTIYGWDMKWRAGLRGLVVYSDSQAANDSTAQRTTNHHWGLGPGGAVDFRHGLGNTGLALFGRLDASIVFGQLTQRYTEDTAAGGFGETDGSIFSQFVQLALQAGLSWEPPWSHHFHLTAGYSFEHFFGLGTSGTPLSPTEELSIQGGFLRAEWNY